MAFAYCSWKTIATPARMVQRILEHEGHEVTWAGGIEAAVAALDGERFDIMISDLGLPDGTGLDLMRRVRQKGLRIPGIALSGYGQERRPGPKAAGRALLRTSSSR